MFTPEDRERIRNLAGHRTKTGIYAERTETRIITRSNREMDLEIAALPVPCEEPDAVMLVLRDITERKRSEQKLLEANQKLQRLSNMDGLTDIANRRYFNAYMKQEWKRAARYSRPLSVIMLDIDYFKEYNDTYGHQGGDRILRETAQVLKKQLQRPGDLAARYGGEEFIFILPDTDAKGAAHMAEKLRKSIEAMKIPNLNSKCSEFVTASVGVASAIPTHLFQPDEMILQADKALYQAKQEGRNCVRVYNPN